MRSEASSIVALNEGGIARLSDNTHWWVAPGHLKKAAAWASDVAVVIEQNIHFYWKFRLRNLESGEYVYAVRSQRALRRSRDAYGDSPSGSPGVPGRLGWAA
jgi:hypothetical protein